MPLSAGDKLGPYEIVALIGAGGMGEVYSARDPRLNRDVAIKVSAERFSDRFEREARAVAALNHPNICQIFDVGSNYIVMELVQGENLKGPLPLETALKYAGQIAAALEAAHEKGVVHRDLKPANIKIKSDGTVKVLDFGLAKIAPIASSDPENSPTMSMMGATQAGVILGTAAYMCPEQARGQAVDKRADIWAFGVVMYEMLAGRKLYHGETASDVMAAVLMQEPDLSKVPARIRPLLRRCLEKDPKKRLRDIGDAMALVETDGPAAEIAPSRSRIGAGGWIAAGAVTLALAALAFVHFREKPPAAELVRFEVPAPSGVTLSSRLALSPDGRKLAFVATAKDSMQMVWIRSLDSREARPLAGTEGAANMLFWSPDSRFIAFVNGGKLRKIEAAGGPPEILCDAATAVDGFWTPDNKIVFGTLGPLMEVSASGGAATPLTALDHSRNELAHQPGALLPDGRHFVYTRLSLPFEMGGIYVGSLDAKPEQQSTKRLLPDTSDVIYAPSAEAGSSGTGFLLFARGLTLSSSTGAATLMAQPFDPKRLDFTGDAVPIAEQVYATGGFSASATGELAYQTAGAQTNRQLTWYDRQGKVLGTPGEPGEYNDVALSPPSGPSQEPAQVAYTRGTDLSLFEFARGVNTRFTFGNPANSAAWSPDGSRIAFISIRSGGFGIYRKASNGAGQEELVFQSPDPKGTVTWSHDGRFLLFDALSADGKTGVDLWVLPVGQGSDRKPVPFLRTEEFEESGRFSPDGRWIAYESNRSGKVEIYVLPFDASNPGSPGSAGLRLVSKDGGTRIRWRGDGKELFYRALDGNIMSVGVNGSGAAFQSETPKVLFKPSSGYFSWDVSADGKKFLVVAEPGAAAAPSSYQVVLNWAQMLKH